ncbi:MAG: recombination protein O N-terminal domain-containing protein [Bdellovibrionales bacterium]|nr:recombination protein O N-terminal domain-containing protein [Bdellovibrionales bacterium]
MTRQTLQIKVLVLRSYPSGEADLVYRLLSSSHGKITAIAKHVKRSKRRFAALPEPFDIGEAEISTTRGDLALFGGFLPRRSPRRLREHLPLFSLGCTLCECFDAMLHEGTLEHSEELFRAACDGLSALNDTSPDHNPLLPASKTIRKLIRLSGFLDDSPRTSDDEERDSIGTTQQWNSLLDRIEEITERPLRTRTFGMRAFETQKSTQIHKDQLRNDEILRTNELGQ